MIGQMTLLEIRGQIIGALCISGIFTTDNFIEVKVPKELSDHHDGIIRAALSQLEMVGLVAKAGDNLWVLSEPLASGGQEVHLSLPICNEIANVINTGLRARDIEEQVDPLNIHEGHIATLLSVIDELLSDDKP